MSTATGALDGNAAAGILSEIFAIDVTAAEAVCAGCGATGMVGNSLAFGLEMGAVLRCPGCDTVLLRVSTLANGRWLDLRGMATLKFQLADR